MTTRKKTLLILFPLFGISLAILVAETSLRFFYPHLVSIGDNAILKKDSKLGWIPKNPITTLSQNSDTINDLIYFTGDSFTDNDKWPQYTISELEKREKKLNGAYGGVAGYGTTQSYLKLQTDLKKIAPKYIIHLFYLWNDLRDNYPYPSIYYNPYMRRRPYLVKKKDTYNLTTPQTQKIPLNSSLLTVIYRSSELLSSKMYSLSSYTQTSNSTSFTYDNVFTWKPLYSEKEQDSPYVKNSWDSTREAFKRMNHIALKNNATLYVIGIDNAFTVDKDVHDKWIDRTLNPSLPINKAKKLFEELNIPFYSCVNSLKKEADLKSKKIYLGPNGNLSGHLTDLGEKVLGREAALFFGRQNDK